MVVTLLIIMHRKPSLSPAEFRQEYEAHIELIKHLTGELFPLSHRRTYIARTSSAPTPAAPVPVPVPVPSAPASTPTPTTSKSPTSPHPTTSTSPTTTETAPEPPACISLHPPSTASSLFGFDVISEATFGDDGEYERFIARMGEPAVRAQVAANITRFAEAAAVSLGVVGDVIETRRECDWGWDVGG
ncbi:uncharacterized protein DSM5745_07575 [Aspergillus mulundensis]|uniref:EthD domain-containing protein n=1 Tax=Aspergillus mulundensis TaxID=1810919 RepID=A0A3D8REB1_9EURO|nr:hypothetical protein DSM5745_07575 [Aspergillus mulundensis]RDW72403.1 hypothetical protein DSM5745_07575 [Aspergillus mulundensis]